MKVEIRYEAPSQVLELDHDEEELWDRYIVAGVTARSHRLSHGWTSQADELYRKVDEAYSDFYAVISRKFDYNVEVKEINEW